MIRLMLLTLMCSACSISTPAPGTSYAMEELVLIEFAARLDGLERREELEVRAGCGGV